MHVLVSTVNALLMWGLKPLHFGICSLDHRPRTKPWTVDHWPWTMDHGSLTVNNAPATLCHGPLTIDQGHVPRTKTVDQYHGQFTLDHGSWSMDHGTIPWTVDHGLWTMDHGPSTMDQGPWTNDNIPLTMDHGTNPSTKTMESRPWTKTTHRGPKSWTLNHGRFEYGAEVPCSNLWGTVTWFDLLWFQMETSMSRYRESVSHDRNSTVH